MIFKIKNRKCFPFSQIVKRNKNSQIGIKKDLKLNQIDNWDLISKNAFKSKVFMDTKNMKTKYARIDDLGFQNLNNPPKCWKMNELKINEIQFIYCCWPQTYKLRSIADVDKMTLNCTSNSINLNRIYDTYQLSSLEGYLNYSSTEQFNLSMNKCRSPWDFDNFKEENERIIAHEEQLSNISLELIKEHNNLLVEQAKNSDNYSSANLWLRNDVILKTIFRSFRKNCALSFKSFFNFTTKKNHNRLIVSKVREYLIKRFGYEDKALMTVFISIIDMKQKYVRVGNSQHNLATSIKDLMYCFKIDKMTELIKWAEFAKILKASNIKLKYLISIQIIFGSRQYSWKDFKE